MKIILPNETLFDVVVVVVVLVEVGLIGVDDVVCVEYCANEPMPVTASQPTPALYAPLLPVVISL
jgi:hypothetical protein